MLSIVMDKSAKERLHAVRETRRSLKKNKNATKSKAIEAPPVAPVEKETPSLDRQELIRNAMAVHKEQSKVLDQLDENEKRRLQLLAMHTMLGKDASRT